MNVKSPHSENLEKAAAIRLLEIITGVFTKQVKTFFFTQESNLGDLSPVPLLLRQSMGFLPVSVCLVVSDKKNIPEKLLILSYALRQFTPLYP